MPEDAKLARELGRETGWVPGAKWLIYRDNAVYNHALRLLSVVQGPEQRQRTLVDLARTYHGKTALALQEWGDDEN